MRTKTRWAKSSSTVATCFFHRSNRDWRRTFAATRQRSAKLGCRFLCQVNHQYFTDRTLTDCRFLRMGATRLRAFRPTWASPAISLLTVERFRIKSAAVKSDGVVQSSVLAELSRRQFPSGGWAALRSSVQACLETSCLATLALGSEHSDEVRLAEDFLVRVQNPNGSWPAFFGDDEDGAWVTSLAAIAVRDSATAIPARLSAFIGS
jgi:hypothetical protein